MPKNVFSMRAECSGDVDAFVRQAQDRGIDFKRIRSEVEPPLPDVEVEFEAVAELADIQAVLDNVVDGHVMRQTLRECPLAVNPLERTYEGT